MKERIKYWKKKDYCMKDFYLFKSTSVGVGRSLLFINNKNINKLNRMLITVNFTQALLF